MLTFHVEREFHFSHRNFGNCNEEMVHQFQLVFQVLRSIPFTRFVGLWPRVYYISMMGKGLTENVTYTHTYRENSTRIQYLKTQFI